MSTSAVAGFTPVTITASYNGTSQPATLTVAPPGPSTVDLIPASLVGGASSTGTVTLVGPAPAGGFSLYLYSTSSAATVPLNVNFLPGATTATFTVNTTPVAASTTVTIYAIYYGNNQYLYTGHDLTILP